MRLFFALWPEVEVARQLSEAARQLKLENSSRRIDPKNYHVTLAFVGEVPAAHFAVLQQIGRSLRANRSTVSLDSIEFWRESRILVAAGRAAPAGLLDLARKLNDAIGLPRQPLRAHVTLARKVTQASVPQAMSPIVWPATHFSLIRSDSGGVASVYTVLDTWPLLDEIRNP